MDRWGQEATGIQQKETGEWSERTCKAFTEDSANPINTASTFLCGEGNGEGNQWRKAMARDTIVKIYYELGLNIILPMLAYQIICGFYD